MRCRTILIAAIVLLASGGNAWARDYLVKIRQLDPTGPFQENYCSTEDQTCSGRFLLVDNNGIPRELWLEVALAPDIIYMRVREGSEFFRFSYKDYFQVSLDRGGNGSYKGLLCRRLPSDDIDDQSILINPVIRHSHDCRGAFEVQAIPR